MTIPYRLKTLWLYVFFSLVRCVDDEISPTFWLFGDVAFCESFVLWATLCPASGMLCMTLRLALASLHMNICMHMYLVRNVHHPV